MLKLAEIMKEKLRFKICRTREILNNFMEFI